jgi:hypothetical protein
MGNMQWAISNKQWVTSNRSVKVYQHRWQMLSATETSVMSIPLRADNILRNKITLQRVGYTLAFYVLSVIT